MHALNVRGEAIAHTSLGSSDARPLVFLHGYARHPLDYRLGLEALVACGWRVEAPFLFANHRLRRPPKSFWDCAALGWRAREALIAAGRIDATTPVVGHSTGGAVALALGAAGGGQHAAPSHIVAVNPVQPSRRRVLTFILRSGWMNTKLACGLAGDGRIGRQVLRESGARFYANWFRDPCRGLALIEGLRGYRYDALARWFSGEVNPTTQARVLYGRGDEFYGDVQGLEDGLTRVFRDVAVRELSDENSHEWLLVRPQRFADEVEALLLSKAA
ncbi:MAG: hypothetical protein R3F49_14605 [Planctomycetota bacterium]